MKQIQKFLSNRPLIFGILAGWVSLALLITISGASGRSLGADAAGNSVACDASLARTAGYINTGDSLALVEQELSQNARACSGTLSYCADLYDLAYGVETRVYDEDQYAWYDYLALLADTYGTECGGYDSAVN